MSAKRQARLEAEREALEAAYREALVTALEECAAGRWGLLGRNDGALPEALASKLRSPAMEALDRIERELSDLRTSLGYSQPFELMSRLRTLRKQNGANSPGEPKLARRFLEELNVLE